MDATRWQRAGLAVFAMMLLLVSGDARAGEEHRHGGWDQWHPQYGAAKLGTAGTQCYFCEKGRRDSDGDGVWDDQDRCPDTPPGVVVDPEGCPIDSDRDGVSDYLDRCPNTPMGVAVNSEGCPPDSDGDGVVDPEDRCPNTPRGAAVNAVGCWVVENLRFETAKADIHPQYYPMLDNVVSVLRANPGLRVEIQGHTDSQGGAKFNQALSERRAAAVMGYLTSRGVDAHRLSARGYGLTQPITDNGTSQGRAMNRRVELKPLL